MGDVPCFVVTHRPFDVPDPVFAVVTDGIQTALAKAQTAAGDKRIGLMGANLDQQFLAAGRVDDIRIHLVNVPLGGNDACSISFRSGVAHLEYRVVR